ncbi:MAG TPA: serine O-acetyltransferase [Candidatus Acidoferrum sp.]|jgi:serine O-acetyltransferase|nr:serine O-acetyltransferase [Candidatus Acidoferrum sp.]
MTSFFRSVREDIAAVFESDPAARSYVEVLLLYPGLHAVWIHHLSHWLWLHGMRFLARFSSQVARLLTGIEIHPGAELGRRLFIDHGIGTVIGETAIVGDDVTLYQGVTLGGTGKEKGKRHPTLGNGISVGSGAKLLGNITIGDNCRVGAGSVVLRNVPANSTIVGVPGHIVLRDGKRVVITDPKDIRDPLSDVIIQLAAEVHDLREKFKQHSHAALGAEPDLPIDGETATPNISPQDLFQDDYQI